MSLLRLRLRSALSLSSPIYQLRRQVSYRPFQKHFTTSSAAYPLPIPRDPSSPPLKLPTDLVSDTEIEYDTASNVCSIVKVLTDLSNLDAAAKYARLVILAVPKNTNDKETETQIAVTCQRVIGGMCAEKRYEEAYDLFHYFFNVNCLAPDYDSCCYVLNALSYQGRLDEAIQFYRRAASYAHFYLEPYALANAMINAARIDEAYDLFFGNYGFSYSVFIRGYLAHGNIHKANEIFQDLKRHETFVEEIAMSQVAYIEHCFKKGKDEEAMELYHSAVAKLAANSYLSTTVNKVVQVLLKYDKKAEAWSLFDKLCGNKMSDEETRCIMIQECIETGEISKALEIAQKEARAVNSPCYQKKKQNYGCYTTVLTALLRQGMMQQHERYPECVDEKIAMSQVAYMDHCFKQGKDEEAMEWYHSAVAKRVASSYTSKRAETVNKVLQVLLKNGKKTEAWSLFDKLCGNRDIEKEEEEEEEEEEDERWDEETRCIMIEECIETGEISKAMEMARKEARPGNSRCYPTVLAGLLRQGIMTEAEEIFNEMFSSGRIPMFCDLWNYRMMVDGFVKAGRFDDAYRFVNKIADVSRNGHHSH